MFKLFLVLTAVTAVLCEQSFLGETSKKKFYTDDAKQTTASAEATCYAMGGTLGTIKDQEDEAFFEALVPQPGRLFWMGAFKLPGQRFHWMDGAPVQTGRWVEPQRALVAGECRGLFLVGDSKLLNNVNCDNLAESLCEVRLLQNSSDAVAAVLEATVGRAANATEGLGSCEGMAKRTEDIQKNMTKMSGRIEKTLEETTNVQERLANFEKEFTKRMTDLMAKLPNVPKALGDRAKDVFGNMGGLAG